MGKVPRRRRVRPTGWKRRTQLGLWVALLLVLWIAQLGLIWSDLGGRGGSGWERFRLYWGWRRLYRPAIALVEQGSTLADAHLATGTLHFHPLDTSAAMQAFIICTGVYAAMLTIAIFAIGALSYRLRT